jgi:hypothetical protein
MNRRSFLGNLFAAAGCAATGAALTTGSMAAATPTVSAEAHLDRASRLLARARPRHAALEDIIAEMRNEPPARNRG